MTINKIFNKYINLELINKIQNNKLNYLEYINIYNNINNEISSLNKSSFEINNFLKNKNKNIKLFLYFIKYKNKNIILNALKSNKWNKNIENLQQILNIKDKKKIEKQYIKLFKEKYLFTWDGFWTSINIDNRGNIVDINTIDIDDINYIKNLK